jgi:FtsP/CotA-like multicopper oxidase with cupredoxin domain
VTYPKYTIERNKTYRIRLINSGSFPAIRFSVDNHPLTLIEADGTLLAPTQVSGVVVTVAQRYSVLLHANQTNVQNGTFWIRATLQSDMFLYQLQGQNVDIRGVIRCGHPPFQSQYQASIANKSALGTQTARNRECLGIQPQPILAQGYPV